MNFGTRYEPIGPWHNFLVGRFQVFDMDAYRGPGRRSCSENVPAGTVLSRRSQHAPKTVPSQTGITSQDASGSAWDVTGDGHSKHPRRRRHVLRHTPAGDYNNGGVNAPPGAVRVNIVDSPSQVGAPFSDPYRPHPDFNALVHDYEDKDTIIGAATHPCRDR